MGLVQIQRSLAQLYTNTAVREAFFADPQRVGSAWGLRPEEVEQLAQVSAREVRLFAHSLHRKRFNAICKLLPLTRQVLGERCAQYFSQYADSYLPNGPKKHRADTLMFATFLTQRVQAESLSPAWVVDVIRYEAMSLHVGDPKCWGAIRWFHYPVRQLIQTVVAQDGEAWRPVCLPQLTIAVWLRLPWKSQLRHVVLSLPRLGWYGTG